MRTDLPRGTVTFLFTDIEGSTRLLHELGDAYAETLAEHRRVVREAFGAQEGVEVDTQGDAFFYVFARAKDAAAAAAAAQAALARGPVRVRMGLHTGEPTVGDEGYLGMDVHRAARVMSAGHGGQVLLSQTTRDLLDESFELCDLGEHRLKDLSAQQRLFQLGNATFPRLKTLHQTNLPVQPTPLVGRLAELKEVLRLLRGSRLVTLTGAGGSGKTRLALHAAAELVDEFPQGVWWVPLSALRDPALVESMIGQAVGASNGLADHLRGQKTLLLLDNFEQVVAAAPAIAAPLAEAPDVRVLVTSRERLGLAGEQEYAVPTLAAPEAVELFKARARQLVPDFDANGVVAQICRRLDGLPLAVELAAARVKVLSPERILERLGHSLDLLTSGPRDAPERQRTLRATIEWSYELLDESERALFACLSVFAGSFDVAAAEAVAGAELDTLAALVDKSLLRHTVADRFFLLETVREFAAEQLDDRGEAEEARERHARAFLARAEEVVPGPFASAFEASHLAWFEQEHDNLRAALDHFAATDIEAELRLVDACHHFWVRRGYWLEGTRRTEDALARAEGAPVRRVARVAWAAGHFAWRHGEYERAKEYSERACALYKAIGASGPEWAQSNDQLALVEHFLGNHERAAELHDVAEELVRGLGDDASLAVLVNQRGNLALDRRDYARARTYFEEGLAIARRLDRKHGIANDLVDLGFLSLAEEQTDEAAAHLRESLFVCIGEGLAETRLWAVEGLAAVALRRGSAEHAVKLLSACAREREQLAVGGYYPIGDLVRGETIEEGRRQLGETVFEAAWSAGSGLSMDAAAEHAALVD